LLGSITGLGISSQAFQLEFECSVQVPFRPISLPHPFLESWNLLGMGENVIRIEIVMAPIEITSYESIDTVALKGRGRKLRPKGQEVEGKCGEGVGGVRPPSIT
jgi:hypothetical protein